MKKWMLVLLAVLVVMLPAWAMAETVDLSDVTLGNEITHQDGYTYTGTVPENQTIKLRYPAVSPGSMSITLKDVQLGEGASLLIIDNNNPSSGDLTITLDGNNTVTGISAFGSLTIDGDGSLTANCKSNDGIMVEGDLTIKDTAKVTATSTYRDNEEDVNGSGIFVYGKLTIQDNAMVTATGLGNSINVHDNLIIQDKATVTATSTGVGRGIAVARGTLTITGSAKVTARGSIDGITSAKGKLTIQTTGDGYVKAYGGNITNGMPLPGYGIKTEAGGDIVLGGNVTAMSGKDENGPSVPGIRAYGNITILPGSRIEATGFGDSGIRAYGTSKLITIQYSKPEDLFVKTGLTKENAVEKTNWNALGSTQTNVTFEQEEVYVLIDTTEKGLPPAPPADASGSLPQTGDSANLALWAVLMAASAACAVMVTRKLRKQH